jgi:uncharacterized protein (TIGR03435 family)
MAAMRMSRIKGTKGLSVLALCAATAISLLAQPGDPAFEVASIKPNQGDSGNALAGFQPGGRFVATNSAVRDLIRLAYGRGGSLDPARLIGGPEWSSRERFDVTAKAEENAPPPLVLGMLRTLLAERFKLVLHTETRDLPIYALTLVRPDGTLGPKLRRTADCTSGEAASPSLPKAARCGGAGQDGHLEFGGVPLAMVIDTAAFLREVQRPVVDRTGLTGAFEGTLDWTPTLVSARNQSPFDLTATPPPDGASIFTAIQEQLGLKLVASRGPVEVFVIDALERPTPD